MIKGLIQTNFLMLLIACMPASAASVQIGVEAKVLPDPKQEHARYVRFRPGDGDFVTMNPPRISWPYLPGVTFKSGSVPATQRFTILIADNPEFKKPAVTVKDTPYNFYNFLPSLTEAETWYWKVGYNTGDGNLRWSKVRSFRISPDAVTWDRSHYTRILDNISGHPRILFNKDNLEAMRGLQEKNRLSGEFARQIIREADQILKSRQYREFPSNDDKPTNYMEYSHGLVYLGFAYLLTGDEKYSGFKERALIMATWPPGGKSSPEGNGQSLKWQTHITEHLGMLYDWFYDEWTDDERQLMKECIEWRLDWTLNSFAWRQQDGKLVKSGSIAAAGGSHPYQNIMAILPGALSICDESEIAREALECGLHYLVGITNGHGEDEGWHDGPGYGNGKMKWLTNATWCLHTAVPDLNLDLNEAYSSYIDFFNRLTPIGAKHSSFGNRGINELDWASSRVMNSLRVAMLCDDGQAMQNWEDTRRRLEDLGRKGLFSSSPYIDYVMPLYAKAPHPAPEADPVGLFASEGWLSVSSAPPSDYDAQKDAVSMVFACRPRGGYNHSFRNENAFDIHAYGETIAVGGGSTSNQSDFANDSMSHNTVLVSGGEQVAAKNRNIPICGRISAFARRENFVYWAGDATPAYGPESGLKEFTRHVLFVDDAYFVIFDELAMEPEAEPATFQWLYHVPAPDMLEVIGENTVSYRIGSTNVLLKHLTPQEALRLEVLSAGEGMKNPVTGKDYRIPNEGQLREVARKKSFGNTSAALPPAADVEHLWFGTRKPLRDTCFLAVVAPYRAGEKEPVIERMGKNGVVITFREKTTRISFDPDIPADIVINTKEL